MKISIAQLNPTIGDINGNLKKLKAAVLEAINEKSDLIIFSELFITGYPPKDLLLQSGFIQKTEAAIKEIKYFSKKYPKIGILVGVPLNSSKVKLLNSALLIYQGKLWSQAKMLLPTYDVFDEIRYFSPANTNDVIPFKNEKLGISICEDAWNDPNLWQEQYNYAVNPINKLVEHGATLLINISASPFRTGIQKIRHQLFSNHALKNKLPLIFVNQVGGNDELIFDGDSMVFDANGNIIGSCPTFKESISHIDLKKSKPINYEPKETIKNVYLALCLGIKDYKDKCGFKKAIIGLSGGIDSSVACCLATKAFGSRNVLGISMPSPYSSKGSIEDSRLLAKNLGIDFKVFPISGIMDSYTKSFKLSFKENIRNLVEENIQARIRGNILMGFSNQYGHLLLSTGNKSELAVGYCTIYGDLCGGISVLADVPKILVYELANFINLNKTLIPKVIINKIPSAELRPDQKDQDTLPPYEILDRILYLFIEEKKSIRDIIRIGFDKDIVHWIANALRKAEYKRFQAPPGFKITRRAFGQGRKMPIAARIN